jgi:hypothetical protein
LLALLVLIGVEALRRQVIREFPDRVETRSPVGLGDALAARLSRTRDGVSPPASAAASSAPDRLEQLERLARLREAGVLDQEELAAEKQRILTTPG